jgi:catechol 2,3-dioxygenase-like lactoylglutathione lyase family enzyme
VILLKLAHVAISVPDLERSAAFYRKHFGFKCQEKYTVEPEKLKICILKKDEVVLELFCFKRHKGLPAYRKDLDSDLKTLGIKHFALKVADIEKTFWRLKKARVRIATDIRTFFNGAKYFFVAAPGGILLELIEGGKK